MLLRDNQNCSHEVKRPTSQHCSTHRSQSDTCRYFPDLEKERSKIIKIIQTLRKSISSSRILNLTTSLQQNWKKKYLAKVIQKKGTIPMLPVTGLLMDVGAHIYNSMKNFWGIYTTLTCYMKPLPNQKYQKSIIKCLHYDWFRRFYHCAKSVRIRKFSGPYFPALGLNTEYLSVFIPNAGKYGPVRIRANFT